MFRVVRGELPANAAGTVDLTVAGFGEVAGAIVFTGSALNGDNPASAPSPGWLCIGYYDGTNQICKAEHSLDAQSVTSDAWKYCWNDQIAGSVNTAGTEQDLYSCAKIANGIRITKDQSAAGTQWYVTAILIPRAGVSDIKCAVMDWSGAVADVAAVTVSDLGFEADLVFGMCGVNPGPNNLDESIQTGWGITHNVDGTDANIVQMSMAFGVNGGRDLTTVTTYTSLYVTDLYGISNCTNSASIRYGARFSGFNANGFTITKYSDTADPAPSAFTPLSSGASFALAEDLLYLAMKFRGTPDIAIFHEVAPTATGSFAVTHPGFRPAFGMMMTPDHTPATINATDTSAASGVGFCLFDENAQYTIGYIDQDNVNTTSVVTWHQTGLQMYELAGNSKFTATLTSFDVNGWTWNFTDVDPSDADNWIGFAISANDAITLTDADGDETWPDGSTGLIATGTGFM